MPKAPRSSSSRGVAKSRPDPLSRSRPRPAGRQALDEELRELDDPGKLKPIKNKKKSKQANNDDDDDEDESGSDDGAPLSRDLSGRILRAIEQQQTETEAESHDGMDQKIDITKLSDGRRRKAAGDEKYRPQHSLAPAADSDSEFDEGDGSDLEELELDAEDEKSLAMFLPQSAQSKRTLADMIFDKLNEANRQLAGPSGASEVSEPPKPLEPRVVKVYSEVANFLSHFTSGKIPKAFKIIPSLRNWEQILLLTEPGQWTAQAVSAATRLFASNLNPRMAQRFYSLVLYPRVRDDIQTHKKLNYHLYCAVKKAIYKPAAFFRGLLLPLAEDGCSVRESVIIASILAKCSIPVLDSSVALLKLAELNSREYSGPTTLFMKTLLNKKYSLPFRVLEAILNFFLQFGHDQRDMPLIWHQALLTFVQRYKSVLKSEERDQIRQLCKRQHHQAIGAEIKRELAAADQLEAASQPAINRISNAKMEFDGGSRKAGRAQSDDMFY